MRLASILLRLVAWELGVVSHQVSLILFLGVLGERLSSRKGAKDAKGRVEGENELSHSPPRHVHRGLQLSLTLLPLAILTARRDTLCLRIFRIPGVKLQVPACKNHTPFDDATPGICDRRERGQERLRRVGGARFEAHCWRCSTLR